MVKTGDGRYPEQWAESQTFDRILLDAPCSATGVIRRHPDIKWLRRDNDINELAALQREILDAVWPYLKPGGTLVYATCSVLPEENIHQINNFLSSHRDAVLTDTPATGYQMLPDAQSGDGFFTLNWLNRHFLPDKQPDDHLYENYYSRCRSGRRHTGRKLSG